MKSSTPLVKHLLLIGGGHSHLAVIRGLGMRPVPGLMTTLVSREVLVPYSGALPACITGHYPPEELFIDLRPLAQFAGVRLIQADIDRIDLDARRAAPPGRPELSFDLLSLNIGSVPDTRGLPGAVEHATAVKPIGDFLRAWEAIRGRAVAGLEQGRSYRLVIVGGGPASVELACAVRERIRAESGGGALLSVAIVAAAEEILPALNRRTRQRAREELGRRGIEVLTGRTARGFAANTVLCDNGDVEADDILVATGAALPRWPAESGLATTEDGFLEVNRHLQSTSHEFVFAAGDAATIKNMERPKSGVYAVRHGKALAENLRRRATGRRLVRFTPQRHALALLNLGDGRALASRNELCFGGRPIWWLKDWIDRRFLGEYRELPAMEQRLEIAEGLIDRRQERELRRHALRCGGCGAKVAGGILREVLEAIPAASASAGGNVEDAAAVPVPAGRELWQTVDQLKAFIDDPWLFAKIATLHCLGDIHAMGARPDSALAIVGVPFANRSITRDLLRELMLGCTSTLAEEGCRLLGGHTSETLELQFALAVNGHAEPGRALRKQGLREDDWLILSKPLGSGTLLAADMRHRAGHAWMREALHWMQVSNRGAARIFLDHDARACTDITGFGLAGHLLEMIVAGPVELDCEKIPVFDGALECLQQGIFSSLHADNRLSEARIQCPEKSRGSARWEILFDPQTAGGLLAAVPGARAESCLAALRESGLEQAAVIGRVGAVEGPARIVLS